MTRAFFKTVSPGHVRRTAVALTCAAAMTTSFGIPTISWANGAIEEVSPSGEGTVVKDRVEVNVAASMSSQFSEDDFSSAGPGGVRASISQVSICLSDFAESANFEATPAWWNQFKLIDPQGNEFVPDANGTVNFWLTTELFLGSGESLPLPGETSLGKEGDQSGLAEPVNPGFVLLNEAIVLWSKPEYPSNIWTEAGEIDEDAIEAAGGKLIPYEQMGYWFDLIDATTPDSPRQDEFRNNLRAYGMNPDNLSGAYFDYEVYEAMHYYQPDEGEDSGPSRGMTRGGDDETLLKWTLVYNGTSMDLFPTGGLSDNVTVNGGNGTYSYTLRGRRTVTDEELPSEASVGEQTGSGVTELFMSTKPAGEYGGTAEPPIVPAPEGTSPLDMVDENGEPAYDGGYIPNPLYNPDIDPEDGLGDNIAFSVPSAINYVVKTNGDLIGPTNAYIENRWNRNLYVSSMKAKAEKDWHFIGDIANASGRKNSVELHVGVAADMLNVVDYVTEKKPVNYPDKWKMGNSNADESEQFVNVADIYTGAVDVNSDDFERDSSYVYIDGQYLPLANTYFEVIESNPVRSIIPTVFVNETDGVTYESDEELFAVRMGTTDVYTRSYYASVPNSNRIRELRILYDGEGQYLTKLSHMEYDAQTEYGNFVALDPSSWNFFAKKKDSFAAKKLFLTTRGTTAHIVDDISTKQKFGELHWYVTGNDGETESEFSPFTATFYNYYSGSNAYSSDPDGEKVSDGETRFNMGGNNIFEPDLSLIWAVVDNDSTTPNSLNLESGNNTVVCRTENDQVIAAESTGHLNNGEWMMYHEEGDDGCLSWNEFFSLSGLSPNDLVGKRLCIGLVLLTTDQEPEGS